MARTNKGFISGIVQCLFPGKRRSHRSNQLLTKVIVETLEPRILLSPLVVTNTNDSGSGSLRAAILTANASRSNQTIDFASTLAGSTINLTSGSPILNDTGATITIDGMSAGSITVKMPGSGGAVFQVVTSAILKGLTITGGSLGGVLVSAPLEVDSCSIMNNSDTGKGGGIRDGVGGMLSINNSTISGNTSAQFGGGIYCGTYTTVAISNCTISGNTGSSGGGIFSNSQYSLAITNSTITGNTATVSTGGMVSQSGSITLNGTIVAKNFAASTESDLSGTGSFSGTYNLIGDNSAAGTSLSSSNTNKLNTNPLLGALGYFGGLTQTIPLLTNSPAIGAVAVGAQASSTDQRGFARSSTEATDIGAFQTNPIVVNSTTDALLGPTSQGVLTLRQAVNLVNKIHGNRDIPKSSGWPRQLKRRASFRL